ncbi:MAG: outer membrane beta-barrel protein [Chitinivibrionales bacterium]|nr:outer membrane beta-barrel protein [Chitinivibrionales bacterium]MBD3355688.1 outer membrane beta-barrel protein [Chitinivibrionales bacterium]
MNVSAASEFVYAQKASTGVSIRQAQHQSTTAPLLICRTVSTNHMLLRCGREGRENLMNCGRSTIARTSAFVAISHLVLATITVYAGNYYPRSGPTFSLGIRSGITASTLWGHGSYVLEDELRGNFFQLGDNARWVLTGGLYLALHFSDFAALQTEINYCGLGKRYEGMSSITGDNETIDIHLDYLIMPIMLKLMLPFTGDNFRPYLAVGPYLGVRLNAQVKKVDQLNENINDLGILNAFRHESAANGETRGVDVGSILGIGVDTRLGPGYFEFGVRGLLGFVGVFDEDTLGANAEEIRNAALWFTGAYHFEF